MTMTWDEFEYLVRCDPERGLLAFSDAERFCWRWIRHHFARLSDVPDDVLVAYVGPRQVDVPVGYSGPKQYAYRLRVTFSNLETRTWWWIDDSTICNTDEVSWPCGAPQRVSVGSTARSRRRTHGA